ncbi:MAG: hypothetical protein HKP58_07280 [Desulfatitalea sp.]|nr:SCP2 sterol-binding domain-containing protein [Desulfatitalea sp.]NNK00200.1 hypothetical protein [Desulfatitalea sp.]
MGFMYPSAEWMKELKRICNEDGEFKNSVGKFKGSFVFQVLPEPGKLEKPAFLKFAIADGSATDAGAAETLDELGDVDYVLEGNYTIWKEVISGKREPLRSIMTRKLKVTKGKQLTLLKNTKMAMRMISNSVKVSSVFADE